MNNDEQHLNLLKIFHYVLAGLSCLLSSLCLFHVFIGWSMMHGREPFGGPATTEPRFVGIMFFTMGIVAICAAWGFAFLVALAGRFIGQRRHPVFCLVIAGLMCAFCNPLGTILGVFTFVVLLRPSVKALFQAPAQEV